MNSVPTSKYAIVQIFSILYEQLPMTVYVKDLANYSNDPFFFLESAKQTGILKKFYNPNSGKTMWISSYDLEPIASELGEYIEHVTGYVLPVPDGGNPFRYTGMSVMETSFFISEAINIIKILHPLHDTIYYRILSGCMIMDISCSRWVVGDDVLWDCEGMDCKTLGSWRLLLEDLERRQQFSSPVKCVPSRIMQSFGDHS